MAEQVQGHHVQPLRGQRPRQRLVHPPGHQLSVQQHDPGVAGAVLGVLEPVATGFALFTLVFSSLLHSEKYNQVKLEPYECGIEPESDSRGRYTVRYYIIAILFVIFDIETIFLFPWAVQFKALGAFGLFEMGIFLAILIVAYVWVYKKGALEWI